MFVRAHRCAHPLCVVAERPAPHGLHGDQNENKAIGPALGSDERIRIGFFNIHSLPYVFQLIPTLKQNGFT